MMSSMESHYFNGQAISSDDKELSLEELDTIESGELLGFEETLPLLASPDSKCKLNVCLRENILFDNVGHKYKIKEGLPILIPEKLEPFYDKRLKISQDQLSDSFLQYYFLSSIKQAGTVVSINAPVSDVSYKRHLFRMKSFLQDISGTVLDVGCDDPLVGSKLLPKGARYIGLDPFCERLSPFRVVGFGENLPFQDGVFDNVVFNTSLDHIFDWRKAIDEADRVLTPGGKIYIASLIWEYCADLITDGVHFHHFRDYEIYGALSNWKIEKVSKYHYKGDKHRYGLYISAVKSLS